MTSAFSIAMLARSTLLGTPSWSTTSPLPPLHRDHPCLQAFWLFSVSPLLLLFYPAVFQQDGSSWPAGLCSGFPPVKGGFSCADLGFRLRVSACVAQANPNLCFPGSSPLSEAGSLGRHRSFVAAEAGELTCVRPRGAGQVTLTQPLLCGTGSSPSYENSADGETSSCPPLGGPVAPLSGAGRLTTGSDVTVVVRRFRHRQRRQRPRGSRLHVGLRPGHLIPEAGRLTLFFLAGVDRMVLPDGEAPSANHSRPSTPSSGKP